MTDKEWIEEQARGLRNLIDNASHSSITRSVLGENFDLLKDFIRTLLNEAPMSKPKVSGAFVDDWYTRIMGMASGDYPELGSDDLEEMLEEAGVEVEK